MGAVLERDQWGLILAGGEGVRLRTLTRAIAGEERPKQFCAPLGGETLLEQTRRRAALVIPPARTFVTLTRRHERFYRALLAGMPRHCAVIEPESRVAAAFRAVRVRPDLLVLLGVVPRSPETEYGWIEPGEPIPDTPLRRVKSYREKPDPRRAKVLLENDCLWNSFVIVGRISTFLAVICQAVPALDAAFASVDSALGTPRETAVVRALYADLAPLDFSEAVLAARPANLAVLPVAGVQWSDWGEPRRVMATLAALGITPEWLGRYTSRTVNPRWQPTCAEPPRGRNTG